MKGDATLQQLVEESIARDGEAFRLLTVLLERKLVGYLTTRTKDREEMLDTLQDVLIDLWHALSRFEYRSEEGFYRFVFTLTKRKVQKRWSLPRLIRLDDVPEPEDTTSAPALVDQALVQRAVSDLGPPESDIISLRHWSCYSFKEIGALLKMKENAVRTRHHRALKKLETTLHCYGT